jgi:solute:Na+ symporter, SSS family
MNLALIVIFASLAIALFLGIKARRGQDMDLEQWTVGGRGFGTLFVFLLLAGEIYTTFKFLGGSSWAYGEGGPAFYILSYGCLAYVMSYWLLPAIWRHATEHRLHSQTLADTNIGIAALFVNFVVLVAVSFATGGFAVRRELSA